MSEKTEGIVWTDLMVEILIDLYKEHECLWNISIPDYKDKEKRTVVTVAEVKRNEYTAKWVNLRTQFLREYNNHKKSVTKVVVSNA